MQEDANRFPTRVEIIVTVFLIVMAVGYAISGVVWGNPWTAITSLLLVAWLSAFWWISLKKSGLRSALIPMGFLMLGAWQLLDYGEDRKLSSLGFAAVFFLVVLLFWLEIRRKKSKARIE